MYPQPRQRRRCAQCSTPSSAQPWQVLAQDAGSVSVGTLVEPRSGYPFRLAAAVDHALSGDRLTVTVRVRNAGDDDAPFGVGMHPYLAVGGVIAAGLDGIENKIHPGGPMDKDLYALPPEELAKVPQVCGSLREALDSLKADHDFLKKGGVFSQDFIDSYIELKMTEVIRFEHTPHPVEFEMYYSA